MTPDHRHSWVKSRTTAPGEVCSICGVRPYVNLTPEPTEVKLADVVRGWNNFEPKVPFSYLVASRAAARER